MSTVLAADPLLVERLRALILEVKDITSMNREQLLHPSLPQGVNVLASLLEQLREQLDSQINGADSVHGLSRREFQVLEDYRSVSEDHRIECYGPLADFFVVSYIGAGPGRIATILSAIAGHSKLTRIVVNDTAFTGLRDHARSHRAALSIQLLEWSSRTIFAMSAWPGNSPVRTRSFHVVCSPRSPTYCTFSLATASLFNNEREATCLSRETKGSHRLVALDGFEVFKGCVSDKPDDRVATEPSPDRARFAVDTSFCPARPPRNAGLSRYPRGAVRYRCIINANSRPRPTFKRLPQER
eukprot:scaffold148972_cov28-Tisochrysis_lutea.AAC.1